MIDLSNYDFDAEATFECGQCFRWENGNGGYLGIADGRICRVCDGRVLCRNEDDEFWKDYFCLDMDYKKLKSSLNKSDLKLTDCIEYGGGIRILHQPLWETTVSFIISANNNIPRIRRIISELCRGFGDEIEYEGVKYHAFPDPQRLAAADISELAYLRAGYRDKYILDAAAKFADLSVNEGELVSMDTPEAKKKLMTIKGVGSKVADCILLFALKRYEVFPQDVWIKRIMRLVYGAEDKDILSFVKSTYGNLGGFAQQYLYYYYRTHPITSEENYST